LPLEGRFFGKFEHCLDQKGRLTLPRKFRPHFGDLAYLTTEREGCLALWHPEEFEKLMESELAKSDRDLLSRNAFRDWSSKVFDLHIDAQNRIALPPELRPRVSSQENVVVVGVINRVELWAPEAWRAGERLAAERAEEELSMLALSGPGMGPTPAPGISG
jgi:MraZ protein